MIDYDPTAAQRRPKTSQEGGHIVRRMFGSLLVAVAAMATVATARAQSEITISPTSGSEQDVFSVEGIGLTPGLALDINFKSPEGDIFTLGDSVWLVDEDGEFEFNFVPAESFVGSGKGVWIVQVCAANTDNCVQGNFQIN